MRGSGALQQRGPWGGEQAGAHATPDGGGRAVHGQEQRGRPGYERPLLEVRGLEVYYPVRTAGEGWRGRWGLGGRRAWLRAVDGVSLRLAPGETLALVGESGCGKTTTARAILRLVEPSAGEIIFDGVPVHALGGRALRRLRRDMQVVFQDPYGSLDPRMTVGASIAEGMVIHRLGNRRERRRRVAELLERVGLRPEHAARYPHEFSGGQRQRIGIARALAVEPRLIVCDEAVSALDVSIQAQVLNLLADLQEERGLAYLFIAHDLAVVRHVAHRVAVMYLGRIVEEGPVERVFAQPLHPYTRALLAAIPADSPAARRLGGGAPHPWRPRGDPPSPLAPPSGCRYRTRCPIAEPACGRDPVPVVEVGQEHRAVCRKAGAEL
ncbi:MAG: peptide ABC transporter ATP-binding protein [Planctomycetota bacterium]|nr:MAG: peptide ABC transporter ATP-binding protein [Planctomycetota bacterium]